MIAGIRGELESIQGAVASLRLDASNGALTYAVHVSAYTAARLGASIDQSIFLFTVHYLESHGQGSNFIPRLAGFQTADDRAFFERFTTCKGIGHRKALRAMTLATPQIAQGIADRDVALLQSLPEIGKRTAETIIATLHDKVDQFLAHPAIHTTVGLGGTTGTGATEVGLAGAALEVLVRLGETRAQATAWIDRALLADNPPQDTEALIGEVYRIKARS